MPRFSQLILISWGVNSEEWTKVKVRVNFESPEVFESKFPGYTNEADLQLWI